jgi:hypothetical protein
MDACGESVAHFRTILWQIPPCASNSRARLAELASPITPTGGKFYRQRRESPQQKPRTETSLCLTNICSSEYAVFSRDGEKGGAGASQAHEYTLPRGLRRRARPPPRSPNARRCAPRRDCYAPTCPGSMPGLYPRACTPAPVCPGLYAGTLTQRRGGGAGDQRGVYTVHRQSVRALCQTFAANVDSGSSWGSVTDAQTPAAIPELPRERRSRSPR